MGRSCKPLPQDILPPNKNHRRTWHSDQILGSLDPCSLLLLVVTYAIVIRVRRAVTATHAQGVELVAVTVAVAFRDVRTSALVDLAWTVAHTARVVAAYAVVDVVTDAIGVGVFRAVTTTFAQGVELVAVTVAVASRDVRTSALVDLSWTVAYTARVIAAYAVVHIVADAIGVSVRCAVTATHAQGVELVAVTVAVASWDVRTSAFVDLSWTIAHTARVIACLRSRPHRRRCHRRRRPLCSHRHTRQGRRAGCRHSRSRQQGCQNIRTRRSLLDHCTHRTRHSAYAVVDVVTDAIGVGVSRAVTTTHAQGVELVAVTVAVASRDVRTSALVDLSWTVAYTARVIAAYAVVHIVADAIGISVSCAVTTTYAQGVVVLTSRAIVGVGRSVVVARSLIRTAENLVHTRTVVVLSGLVVVGRRGIGTTASVAAATANRTCQRR